jgi:hypothetical protein
MYLAVGASNEPKFRFEVHEGDLKLKTLAIVQGMRVGDLQVPQVLQ